MTYTAGCHHSKKIPRIQNATDPSWKLSKSMDYFCMMSLKMISCRVKQVQNIKNLVCPNTLLEHIFIPKSTLYMNTEQKN